MAKRDMHYRTKSLQELINGYAHEVGRNNIQERKAAQRAITLEVYARIKDTFDMLDKDPDAAEKIYRQLIEH